MKTHRSWQHAVIVVNHCLLKNKNWLLLIINPPFHLRPNASWNWSWSFTNAHCCHFELQASAPTSWDQPAPTYASPSLSCRLFLAYDANTCSVQYTCISYIIINDVWCHSPTKIAEIRQAIVVASSASHVKYEGWQSTPRPFTTKRWCYPAKMYVATGVNLPFSRSMYRSHEPMINHNHP